MKPVDYLRAARLGVDTRLLRSLSVKAAAAILGAQLGTKQLSPANSRMDELKEHTNG